MQQQDQQQQQQGQPQWQTAQGYGQNVSPLVEVEVAPNKVLTIIQLIVAIASVFTFWAAFWWGIFLAAWVITVAIICINHLNDIYRSTCCMSPAGWLTSALVAHICTLIGACVDGIVSIIAIVVYSNNNQTVFFVFAILNLLVMIALGVVTIILLIKHNMLSAVCRADPDFVANSAMTTGVVPGAAPMQTQTVQGQPVQGQPVYNNDPYNNQQQQQQQNQYPPQQNNSQYGADPYYGNQQQQQQQQGHYPQQQQQGHYPAQQQQQQGYPPAQNPGYQPQYQQQQQQQ